MNNKRLEYIRKMHNKRLEYIKNLKPLNINVKLKIPCAICGYVHNENEDCILNKEIKKQ